MVAKLNESILLKYIKIYQWIFSLFGLNIPPFLIYRSQKDTKYFLVLFLYFLYSVILLALCIRVITIHNKIITLGTNMYKLDSLTEIMSHIQHFVQMGLLFFMEYKTWCGHQKLLSLLVLIQKLENNLFKICPQTFKQQQLKKRLLQTVGVFLIILPLFIFYVMYQLIAHRMAIKDKLFSSFFLVCLQIKFLEYGTYVQLIREYLIMLLKSLKYLKAKIESISVKERKQSLPWYYLNTLRQNQMSLMEVGKLVSKLEHYFAWPIFLLMLFNGLSVLFTVNWAYLHYLYETKVIFQIFRLAYVALILLNMLLLCCLTQKCINEYQNFSHVLLNFKLYPHDKQMIMAIKEYSLQLLHQPIQFTCNGYMNIDLGYFGKIILIIGSYAIVLVQFKLTDVSQGVLLATKSIFGRA